MYSCVCLCVYTHSLTEYTHTNTHTYTHTHNRRPEGWQRKHVDLGDEIFEMPMAGPYTGMGDHIVPVLDEPEQDRN